MDGSVGSGTGYRYLVTLLTGIGVCDGIYTLSGIGVPFLYSSLSTKMGAGSLIVRTLMPYSRLV